MADPTAEQISRLRRDTGTDETSLPDEDIPDLYAEAGESYANELAQEAYVRVLVLRGLLASSAPLTDYTQNNSQESASDVFDHTQELLSYWEQQLATAVALATGNASTGGAFFGRVRGRESLRRPPLPWSVTRG